MHGVPLLSEGKAAVCSALHVQFACLLSSSLSSAMRSDLASDLAAQLGNRVRGIRLQSSHQCLIVTSESAVWLKAVDPSPCCGEGLASLLRAAANTTARNLAKRLMQVCWQFSYGFQGLPICQRMLAV